MKNLTEKVNLKVYQIKFKKKKKKGLSRRFTNVNTTKWVVKTAPLFLRKVMLIKMENPKSKLGQIHYTNQKNF
jgi:hypothetical protein